MTDAEKMLDIKEYALKYHYDERTIRQYCIDGKIKGASKLTKDSRKWLIPASAVLELKPQTNVLIPDAKPHDKEIFKKSDVILNEHDFENIFEFLSRNSCLKSQLIGLLRFPKYFDSESNKYSDWRLNYACLELCNKLKELSSYIESDSVERDLVSSFYDKYKENSVENEYTRFLKKLLDDTPDLVSPGLDELYLIMDENLCIWLDLHNQPELSDSFHSERSWEFQKELSQLVDNARNAYKSYRVSVRETLFL